MKWRARFRARKRRLALSALLPAFEQPQETENVIVIALDVPTTQLIDPDTGRVDFHKRAEVCNYVGSRAAIEASRLIRERFPVQFPDQFGDKFKEGWKGLAANY